MMKRAFWLAFFLTLSPALLQAASMPFHQDVEYEQMLRYQASPDHIVTPARVIRWLLGRTTTPLRGSSAEFQPIFNMQQSRVRVIAAVAIKFN